MVVRALADWWRLLRPFTLLPPALGIASGAIAAAAVAGRAAGTGTIAGVVAAGPAIVRGAVMAALLNAASNVLNQICERELDGINKPDRPLPAGRIGLGAAWVVCVVLYLAALALAWTLEPLPGRHDTFWCALAAAVCTVAYSVKPIYAKSRGWWANIVIAVPRGALLKVAGWGCVAPALGEPEAWWIGAMFAAFLLGAASTKDIADAIGDARAGCRTLVVRHGVKRAVRLMIPFLIWPWLLLPLGTVLTWHGRPLVSAPTLAAAGAAAVLMAYGWYVAALLRADGRGHDGNHPAWTHMYALMMLAQIALALAYLA